MLLTNCKKNDIKINQVSSCDLFKQDANGFFIHQTIYHAVNGYPPIVDTLNNKDTIYNIMTYAQSNYGSDSNYFSYCLDLDTSTFNYIPIVWDNYHSNCRIDLKVVKELCNSKKEFSKEITVAPINKITLNTGTYLGTDENGNNIEVVVKIDSFINFDNELFIFPCIYNFPENCTKRIVNDKKYSTHKFLIYNDSTQLFPNCEQLVGAGNLVNNKLTIEYNFIKNNKIEPTKHYFNAIKIK